MAAEVTLYGLSSPNVMKVVVMLEEIELPYHFLPINIWTHEQFSESFQELNPNSKVPVLIDPEGPDGDPITLFESGAILIYLAEKSGRFLPPAPKARYATLQWLMVQMGSIGPMFGQATHFRRSGPDGSSYALDRYVSEVHRLFEVIEARLGVAAWLGGSDYSIADMATYPWISMYYEANGVVLDRFPAVGRWLAANAARPAVQRVEAFWVGLQAEDMARRAQADADGFDHLFGRGRYARK